MTIEVGQELNYDGYDAGRIAFEDDFTGGSIDTNKWVREYRWGPTIAINGEEQYYDDGNLDPDPGTLGFPGTHLEMNALETPANVQAQAVCGVRQMPYVSAVLSTADKFEIFHSRAEIELWLPGTAATEDSDGAFPAFWAQAYFPRSNGSGYGGYPILPEWDIMEWCGNEEKEVHFSTHADPGRAGNLVSSGSLFTLEDDLRGAWHKFGSQWDAEKILFYIDDRVLFEKPTPKSWVHDMFFNLNLAISDGETGFGAKAEITGNSVFPMQLQARNMKVWPIAESGKLYHIPQGIAKKVDATTAGVPICHSKPDVVVASDRLKLNEESEIFVDYLDGLAVEQPYTGDSSAVNADSTIGSAGDPKVVIWNVLDKPNAYIFCHRHMKVKIVGAINGGEYTMSTTNSANSGMTMVFDAATLVSAKHTLDSVPQFADDAYVMHLFKFKVVRGFILPIDVTHYG